MSDYDLKPYSPMTPVSIPTSQLPQHCCRHHCMCEGNPDRADVCDCAPREPAPTRERLVLDYGRDQPITQYQSA